MQLRHLWLVSRAFLTSPVASRLPPRSETRLIAGCSALIFRRPENFNREKIQISHNLYAIWRNRVMIGRRLRNAISLLHIIPSSCENAEYRVTFEWDDEYPNLYASLPKKRIALENKTSEKLFVLSKSWNLSSPSFSSWAVSVLLALPASCLSWAVEAQAE